MNLEKFDYFYKEFEELNQLLEIANIQKTKEKTSNNVFEVYKKMNDYNNLKKKIIKEFSEINPTWTERYNDYDNHPVKMLPFPEIYDLTELDENNFKFFHKEFEKLDNIFLKTYCDPEKYKNVIIEEEEEDKEEEEIKEKPTLGEDDGKKLKGYIGSYYSVNGVLEYLKQEEKITKELGKINQKWLESKNEHQIVRYEGDLSLKTTNFQYPRIYTLFEKLIQYNIEIQKFKEERKTYKVEENQYKFEQTKKEILDMV
jgi:hypothetical protein